jgi:hypothetical protein
LNAKLKTAKQDFIDQATQAGFAKEEVGKYAKSFDDMKTAIDGVPRDITVGLNISPAETALGEFLAKVAASSASVSLTADVGDLDGAKELAFTAWLTKGIESGAIGGAATPDALARLRGAFFSGAFGNTTKKEDKSTAPNKGKGSSGGGGGASGSGFFGGGYTGNISEYAKAGDVHGKEFVFDAEATRNIGPGELAYLQAAAKGSRRTSSAPTSAPSGSGLTPDDRRFIQDAGRTNVSIGWHTMAPVNAAYNEDFSRRGGN